MKNNYDSILGEYKKSTESLIFMEADLKLKEKNGNDTLKKYGTKIKKLSVSEFIKNN